MKSYFLLLRLNLRNLLAGFRGAMRKPNGKIDISRLILYPLALLGMLTLAGFVIFMEFSMFSAFEMLNAPEMLPGLAILLAMVTALLFSVFQMLAALYFSRDTASMAYLPLTSRTVLAAKWTEVYVSELLFSLLIAAPAVVLYGIHYAADWTYYLRMVPVLLVVNCIPLTISLLLASILGRFTSLTRHKEVWVVLGTVLMLVVVLGLEWSILPKIPEDADAALRADADWRSADAARLHPCVPAGCVGGGRHCGRLAAMAGISGGVHRRRGAGDCAGRRQLSGYDAPAE